MVGGRLFCCFHTCSFALLLWVCLQDVEASRETRVVHKEVGDTVVLSPGSPPENVTEATWRYEGTKVADKDSGVSKSSPFKGRSELNSADFALTLRNLTVQDSGVFSFVSAVNDKQSPTVFITLRVHELITQPPVIEINSTWIASDESCTVLLDCNSTDSAIYSWTVGKQTLNGSKQQHMIRVQDGETTVTCTVSNHVSEKSASATVTCISSSTRNNPDDVILFMGVGAGSLILLIIVIIIVALCCCKKRHAGSDTNDLTVYADIGEVTSEDATSSTMTPCSVYETIDNRVPSHCPGPQTVYDKIQLNRVRKVSVSPYQEVS